MASNLVIVESPSKAKTIGKYLGPSYVVKASMGHLRDLPKSTLGVNIEKGFEPEYLPMENKAEVINELRKPGRDPRESAQEFEFAQDIKTIEDVKTGMELPGIVTNITAFGAFVDIGIKQNGLIHTTQMGVKGMADPSKILKLHQQVKVTVISVDLDRDRIGLRLMK